MKDEGKNIVWWWFVSVSFMTIGVMYLVNYEPSTIILNAFIAPVSIILFFVYNLFKDKLTERGNKDGK